MWGEPFGSTKNFYCCRYSHRPRLPTPLEVLRISTVVDIDDTLLLSWPLEVLRISTVVDVQRTARLHSPLEVLRISTVVDKRKVMAFSVLWKY